MLFSPKRVRAASIAGVACMSSFALAVSPEHSDITPQPLTISVPELAAEKMPVAHAVVDPKLPQNDSSSERVTEPTQDVVSTSTVAGRGDEQSVSATSSNEYVVTYTQNDKHRNDIASTISSASQQDIDDTHAAHPSELLNKMAGVHVNNLGGEGHMTSIRQPITTSAVYLYLEDGLPTRPTGLFNHNALYEINLPQAERVEVIKGPGSSLYGSDSIGGVINSVTEDAPFEPEFSADVEGGSHGWKRALVSAGAPINKNHRVRVNANVTDSDGFRDASEFTRQSVSVKNQGYLGNKTYYESLVSYNDIDQSGVASISDSELIAGKTEHNNFHGDIGARQVTALRASSEIKFEPDANTSVSVRPYYRKNTMSMVPSWMITYDPNQRDYEFESYGVNSKYHKRFESGDVIVGVDSDYTPSTYKQQGVSVLDAKGAPCYDRANGYVNACAKTEAGGEHYDYSADQTSISPYVHAEYLVSNDTKIDAGVRYDHVRVNYTDRVDASVPETVGRSTHLRPDSQTLRYDNVSPKLGITHRVSDKHAVFASHKQSFRAPSIGRLFTSGSTPNTDRLKPVKAISHEVGIRGALGDDTKYDLSVYHMQVTDDIVNIVRDGDRQITNAGKTEHAGVELSLAHAISDELSVDLATSYRKQTYDAFSGTFFNRATFQQEEVDFSGNELPRAPKLMSNVSMSYEPKQLAGSMFELEWQGLSAYFADEENTQTYDGHQLLNLRAHYDVDEHTRVYGRVMNVTDEAHSNYSSQSVGGGTLSHNPGAPRSVYVGVKKTWK